MPEEILVKREAAAVGGVSHLVNPVQYLFSVVANSEHYADGHEEVWLLLDTKEVALI